MRQFNEDILTAAVVASWRLPSHFRPTSVKNLRLGLYGLCNLPERRQRW